MPTDETKSEDRMLTVGGPVDRVQVSLRLFGDDLNPDEVSHLLNCLPSKSHVKGDVIVGKHTGRSRIAHTGSWLLKSDEDQDVELNEQILKLLGRVSDDLSVWEGLASKYDVDLFCGLFLDMENRECWLSAETMLRLAERGLSIGFDIYAVFADEEKDIP
jgi:hypothetical protein